MALDFDLVLQPISENAPAGENLEYELIYHKIREARKEDPDFLPEDEWSAPRRQANWQQVKTLCLDALTAYSKDYQIVCWLIESLLKTEGLEGLAQGYVLLTRFISLYWQQAWPPYDEDGLEMRITQFGWLDRRIADMINGRPLFSSYEDITLMLWTLAQQRKYQGKGADTEADYDFDEVQQILFNQPEEEKLALLAVTQVCLAELDNVELSYQTYNSHVEHVFHQQRQTLEQLLTLLERIVNQTPIMIGSGDVETCLIDVEKSVIQPEEQCKIHHDNATLTRQSALTQLHQIAKFFRQSEPSSPVPFLLERACRWASMDLTQWLEEMLDDKDDLKSINKILDGKIQHD